MILPPILLGQCKLYRDGQRPLAFAAWAYLSEEAEVRLEAGATRLGPSDWKCGDRLWLVNVVATFAAPDAILKDLRETALVAKTFKLHRATESGDKSVVIVRACT
jgi:cytolysin-activating lysine-acyltransferase